MPLGVAKKREKCESMYRQVQIYACSDRGTVRNFCLIVLLYVQDLRSGHSPQML